MLRAEAVKISAKPPKASAASSAAWTWPAAAAGPRGRRGPWMPRCARWAGHSRGPRRGQQRQFGVVPAVIPAAAPELGLGEERQRLTGKPDLEPGLDPLHRHAQVVRRSPQVTGPELDQAAVGNRVGLGGRHHRRPLEQVAEQAERLVALAAEGERYGAHAAGGVVPRLAAGGAAQRAVQPDGGLGERAGYPEQHAEPDRGLRACRRFRHGIMSVPRRLQQGPRVHRPRREQGELARKPRPCGH